MSRHRCNWCASSHAARRGLTLAELLIASAIMGVIVATLAAMSLAVQQESEYGRGQGDATQHARVALERMERAVREAAATEQFPGCFVFHTHIGTWSFPDTLVVWRPAARNPAPTATPLVGELVVFCADPAQANRLLEITMPGDTRPAPAWGDEPGWASQLHEIRTIGERVELTNLLRVGSVNDGVTANQRGAVRFQVRLRPDQQEWERFRIGDLAWTDLAWPMDMVGARTGLRQVWCSIELQLMPGANSYQWDPNGQSAVPFFGSAALFYQLEQ